MAKTRQISFRLPEAEYQRIVEVYERAKERTMGYAPLGDVIREALGLIPLNVITDNDLLSLRSGSRPEAEKPPNISVRPRVRGRHQ